MAIDLASASAELRLDVSNFVTNAQRASDAAQGIQRSTDNVTNSGFLGWVQQNEKALNKWGKGLLGFGALVTGSFAAPIIAGSRATWGQVDAIEQATVAMNAYADSSEDVDMVLGSLLDYARSAESGGLFWREELFASAQSMLIYGASIEEVDEYVKILSRSVGLGLSDWDSLNTIIGRVGSTGRLTGNDFDMLTARGFDLDESIRNTDITWQEFFGHLDAGIPADALAGQMDTIRGKGLWLQDALQGLGRAFLGVDSESGKFIEGGLGWQMVRGMERLTDLMLRAAPAVGNLGSIFAAIGRPIGMAIDFLIRLPQPIQTAMLMFTGATGVISLFSGGLLLMLPRIASTVLAFQQLGGMAGIIGGVTRAVGALRVAMVGLFMNPAMLAAAAFFGTLWILYQNNVLGFADAVDTAWEKVRGFLDDFFGSSDTKTFHILTEFDAGAHTITQTTLPDGTKVWNVVEDSTGETFGQILESYTNYDGTTYILVEPEGDGEPFWMKADLETGKPEQIEIPIVGEDSDYQLTLDTITSATGNEVTVVINGDGEPVGTVLDGIISDPATGEKTITLELGNGQQFIATVDATTGSIVLQREIEIDSDISPFMQKVQEVQDWFNRFEEQFVAFMNHDWATFDWRETFDIVGLEGLIGPIETMIDWWNRLEDAVRDAISAVDEFFGGSTDLEDVSPENPGGGYIEGYDERGIPIDSESSTGVTRTPRSGEQGANTTQYDRDTSPAFSGLRAGSGIGGYFRDAAIGAGLFNDALTVLNPEILRSNDNFNTTASTVPVYTSATEDADSATGAMAGNMASNFGSVSASALTHFFAMQDEATTRTAAMNRLTTADTNSMRAAVLNNMLQMRSGAATQAAAMQSAVTGSMLGMRASSATQLSLLASSANTQTSNMQRSAATNASGMQSSVAGSMLGMRTASALQMGMMASSAATSGSQMDTGLTGWMTGARVRIVASMASMVQAVRNTGSAGYSAGHYAGSRIGEGMAAGMNAWLGAIRASANSMVAAASAAVTARAMISSPSRLFMQYGEYIGEGLEIGMRSMIPAIGRTAGDMIPSPEFNTPINRGGYGGGTQIIDNSTHTTEFVSLNDKQFHELLQAKERTNRMYNSTRDANALAGWEG